MPSWAASSFPYTYTRPQQKAGAGLGGVTGSTVDEQPYWFFRHGATILGYMCGWVVERIKWDPQLWHVDPESRTVEMRAKDGEWNVQERTRAVAGFFEDLRQKGVFRLLDGWRGEPYTVYGEGKEVLMSVERSAAPLLGVVNYGVHMTAYVRDGEGMKMWVPRRAMTKQTYPGMMDNTVGGGLTTGEKPIDCLVREAHEEASLPQQFVRDHARPCGMVTYFHIRDEREGGEVGLCQPECQYVYDLELPASVIPVPDDNEAEDFRLLDMDEVRSAMAEGKFKPNCALLLLDFLVRHGILTPENEPDYLEIVSRIHRRVDFPTA